MEFNNLPEIYKCFVTHYVTEFGITEAEAKTLIISEYLEYEKVTNTKNNKNKNEQQISTG